LSCKTCISGRVGGGSTDKGLKEGDVGFLVGGEGAEEGRGIHVEWF
jgi:hypothetical protein